jgi:hypothetical protein
MTKLNLTDKLQKKLIDNSYKAFQNSKSQWAKNFWFNIWKNLCKKYGRQIH